MSRASRPALHRLSRQTDKLFRASLFPRRLILRVSAFFPSISLYDGPPPPPSSQCTVFCLFVFVFSTPLAKTPGNVAVRAGGEGGTLKNSILLGRRNYTHAYIFYLAPRESDEYLNISYWPRVSGNAEKTKINIPLGETTRSPTSWYAWEGVWLIECVPCLRAYYIYIYI